MQTKTTDKINPKLKKGRSHQSKQPEEGSKIIKYIAVFSFEVNASVKDKWIPTSCGVTPVQS